MEEPTKNSLMRYYASLTIEELLANKAEIGHLLKEGKIRDIENIKVSIAIINYELKTRNEIRGSV